MEDQNQDSQKKSHKENQPKADLNIPTLDHDPDGKAVYHPAIGKRTLWGGLIGGILVGLVGWLLASGVWPISGLGQISSASPGAATFFGFVTGSAIGGLAGSISGLRYMLLTQDEHSPGV